MNTRKKVKIIGTESYINQRTGEIQEAQVVSIEERDANFHKIWLGHVIQTMDLIGNQKIRFAFWLLEQMNSENLIIMTFRRMREKSGMSNDTIIRTVKALVDSDFLIKIQSGVYQVNPDMIFKGGKGNRLNVLLSYTNTKSENEAEDSLDFDDSQEIPEILQETGDLSVDYEHDGYTYAARVEQKPKPVVILPSEREKQRLEGQKRRIQRLDVRY